MHFLYRYFFMKKSNFMSNNTNLRLNAIEPTFYPKTNLISL